MFPSKNANKEQQSWNNPCNGDHPDNAVFRSPTSVFRCYFYRTKSIYCDKKNSILRY